MAFNYDPNYVPSGRNNKVNEYNKKINHVRIAKQDSSRTEFLLGPGQPGNDPYAVDGISPQLVADFVANYYRKGGDQAGTTFEDVLSFTRTGPATFVNASGLIETADAGVARVGHHVWSGSAWENKGILLEPTGTTNLIQDSAAPGDQSLGVSSGTTYTLHFVGTGSIQLTGGYNGTLNGGGAGEQNRVSMTFTTTSTLVNVIVTGDVSNVQVELGSLPTSYIQTPVDGTATRAAEDLRIPQANVGWSADAMSYVWKGQTTRFDSGVGSSLFVYNQTISNRFQSLIQTSDGSQISRVRNGDNINLVGPFVAPQAPIISDLNVAVANKYVSQNTGAEQELSHAAGGINFNSSFAQGNALPSPADIRFGQDLTESSTVPFNINTYRVFEGVGFTQAQLQEASSQEDFST